MGYLLVIIRTLISGGTTIIDKNYMMGTGAVKSNFDIYAIITYPLATLWYLILANFSVPLNFVTFFFSFALAFISLTVTWCSMVGYNYATITYLTVFSSAGGTVLAFLYEWIFTDDTFSLCMILSIVARMLAVFVPLIYAKKEKAMGLKGFGFCMLYFLLTGASSILMRIYVDTPNVMSTASMCFWVNIIILPVAFTKIFMSAFKDKEGGIKRLASDAKLIKPKYYVWMVVSMLIANVSNIIGYDIVKLIGGTASAVIGGSFGMIVSVAISVFVYKEHASKQAVASAVMSVVAVILSVF